MKVTVPINIGVIIKQLPLEEKLRLVRQLEKETWASRLDQIVNKIRSRRSIKELSSNEINRIVEDVRKTRYARTASSRS